MIMCVECGAEADGGKTCPRCGVALPADRWAKALSRASGTIGIGCAIAASIGIIVDYAMNGRLGWSVVGLASSVAAWTLIGFPMLVYRKPGLFLPVMGAAALAFLGVLDALTGASGWFLPLALPIGLAAMASGALSTFLCLKARRHGPNIAAYVLVGATLACLSIEGILSLHFRGSLAFSWSAVVAASALPLAALLLGIQHRLRPPDQGPSLANSSSK